MANGWIGMVKYMFRIQPSVIHHMQPLDIVCTVYIPGQENI